MVITYKCALDSPFCIHAHIRTYIYIYVLLRHGLAKDFETANIFVPPEQVRDTVDLWRLPDRRMISLKFLAAYVLDADIQDEVHDSIEDAKTALLLYKKYLELKEQGDEVVQAKILELYSIGQQNNWTVGVEKLRRS